MIWRVVFINLFFLFKGYDWRIVAVSKGSMQGHYRVVYANATRDTLVRWSDDLMYNPSSDE
jgi:hypothetical protein